MSARAKKKVSPPPAPARDEPVDLDDLPPDLREELLDRIAEAKREGGKWYPWREALREIREELRTMSDEERQRVAAEEDAFRAGGPVRPAR